MISFLQLDDLTIANLNDRFSHKFCLFLVSNRKYLLSKDLRKKLFLIKKRRSKNDRLLNNSVKNVANFT